jgi:hypothetical protein
LRKIHAASGEMYWKHKSGSQGTLGNVLKGSWRPFEQHLKGIGDSLGNTQRIWKTLSAMLKEKPSKQKWRPEVAFSHCVSRFLRWLHEGEKPDRKS